MAMTMQRNKKALATGRTVDATAKMMLRRERSRPKSRTWRQGATVNYELETMITC